MAVSPINVSSDAALTPEMKTYYNRTLLELSKKKTVMNQFGISASIPANQGKTIEWRRSSQFTDLTGAATALTEGTTPTGSSLTITSITATIATYGDFYAGSDLVSLTTYDKLLTIVTEQQAYQLARVLDNLASTVIYGGTTVQYANGRASRITVAAGDVITEVELRKVRRTLKNNSVMPLKDGTYAAIIHPYTWYDLMSDVNIRSTMQYSAADRLFDGEVGKYMGFRFVESELAPVIAGGGAAGIDVYQTLFQGSDFFGKVKLNELNVASIFKPVGSGGTEDPLEQRWTQGWKAAYVAKILDDSKAVRLEHAVSA